MKKRSIPALLLGSIMLLQALPVSAAYQSAEEITLAVRPMHSSEGVYIPEDTQQVYVSPAAAAAGTTLHVGIFIEAERADLNMIVLDLVTDSESLCFDPASYRNPKMDMAEAASVYTLPDGTEFESLFIPYCLGKLSAQGRYNSSCYAMSTNFMEDNRRFRLNWQYGPLGNAESFLGGASDAFSLSEMDAALAAGTAPGEYHIRFDHTDSVAEDENKSRTIITSNETVDSKTAYADLVPGLKDLSVVVGAAQYDGAAQAFRFADETKAASPADLPGTVQVLKDGTLTEAALTNAAFSYAEAPAFPDVVTVPQTSEASLLYDGSPALTAEGRPVNVTYRIGLRGDVDLDGAVTASDAARILIFSARKGAGEEAHIADTEDDAFAQFLGDVNGSSDAQELNASDAACVLIYAAVTGSGQTPDWEKILHPAA